LKNYTDSDYALNKYSEGIVYRFADKIVEVTLDAYLSENPGKTESDFQTLKELSDTIYLEQVQNDNTKTYKDVSYDSLEETTFCCVQSTEESFIDGIDEQEVSKRKAEQITLAEKAMNNLTDVQRKRYIMYKIEGLSTRKIADLDRVSHQSILECLAAAEKKIKKFLANS